MSKWWGNISFKDDQIKSWRIGSRQIIIQRKKQEWIVWNQESKNESDEALQLDTLDNVSSLEHIDRQRFLVDKTETSLSVTPALADRSIVIRPGYPITVLPGEHAELNVSTPLWLNIKTTNQSTALTEIPFWLPSDSWFGQSTMDGELCYAKYSDAKVSLDNIKRRSHRAITRINITNQHEEALTVLRINLPVPFLDLYTDEKHQFWTDSVNLTHNEDDNLPTLSITKLNNASATNPTKLVAEARQIADKHTFMRSIKSLVA